MHIACVVSIASAWLTAFSDFFDLSEIRADNIRYMTNAISMTKSEAIAAFGSVCRLADELGVVRQAIYKWPEVLSQKRVDWVNGASLRVFNKPVKRAVSS